MHYQVGVMNMRIFLNAFFFFFFLGCVGTKEGKIKWSCHLVIWSRNHEYSVLSSLGSEFRYALGNVLGTQDCPILRLASHHCVLYLNSIKNHLNTCILDSHTHTHNNMHLANNMASLTLKTYLFIYPNKR